MAILKLEKRRYPLAQAFMCCICAFRLSAAGVGNSVAM